MALLLAWVSLGVCMLLVAACVALYVDAKGARETLAAWKSATEARLESYAARLAAVEGGPPSPRPAGAVARGAAGASPSEPKSAPRAALVSCSEDDVGRAALLPGCLDDCRKTMIGVAPPAGDMTRGERVALGEVTHCYGEACKPTGDLCACECETCVSLGALLAQAERETAGVE